VPNHCRAGHLSAQQEIDAMTMFSRFALAALLLAAPLAVHAQESTTAPTGTRREHATERRDAMRARRDARKTMTPEEREATKAAAQARREARISAMPPEQQQFMRDLRTYQQGLRARARELQSQVAAGTLTRDAMASDLKAYREANRPARPAGMPDRRRTP
jgi:hypothetical protein